MGKQRGLDWWLNDRCSEEHLSLRRAGAKTGLSHGTIADILRGGSPTAETVKKLAQGFSSGDGQKLALEDHLLVLAGYRSERQEEESSELVSQLRDREKQLSDLQLRIMVSFADFLIEIGRE